MSRPHSRRHLHLVDPLPPQTRYDAEWASVRAAERDEPWELALLRAQDVALAEWLTTQEAAEAPGGDLAAMAAPLTGWGEYEIEPEAILLASALDVVTEMDAARLDVKPRGRHRQTDPLDLILADLRDLDGLSAHPPVPPVSDEDVETLAGLVDEAGVRAVANASSRLIARRLLATGRVSVTHE